MKLLYILLKMQLLFLCLTLPLPLLAIDVNVADENGNVLTYSYDTDDGPATFTGIKSYAEDAEKAGHIVIADAVNDENGISHVVKYVAGGSAANTITCTAIFGMPSGFIGKIGNDELGLLFKSDQEQYGVQSRLLTSEHASGRSMVFVSGGNAERTFAVYLGAALDLVPEDLDPEWFKGYDYFHIEGYLVQNQDLVRRPGAPRRRACPRGRLHHLPGPCFL